MNQEISRRISFLGFVMTCGIVLYHCGPSPAVPSVGLDRYVLMPYQTSSQIPRHLPCPIFLQ